MAGWLTALLLVAGVGGRPVRVLPKPRPMASAPAAGPVHFMTASPASISFQAGDPDSPSVPGNSAAVVTWSATGNNGRTWNLTVRSAASSFTNCPTVPVSAVTVTCTGATVSDGGRGTCAAPFTLSTSPQILIGGNEGSGGNADYAVNLSFTLADSWKYIARTSPQCSLFLTYTATLD